MDLFERKTGDQRLMVLMAAVFLFWVLWVYWPGLEGPYLLDDFINIPQAQVADLDWESGARAVTSNTSGIFGRPIPVLTFVLNYQFFGGDAHGYKAVNLAIHILNCVLVFWLVKHLVVCFISFGANRRTAAPDAHVVAAMVTLVWAIHPLQISTVLYVFQRVMLLVSFFTLCSLLAYVTGRRNMLEKGGGLKILFLIFPLFTLLAIFSKENGALIIPYIVVIEALIFRFSTRTPYQKRALYVFQIVFVVIPVALSIYYFWSHTDVILEGYGNRNFTLAERLLTEPGVLVFYLKMILLPSLTDMSFYHDAYPVSRAFSGQVMLSVSILVFLMAVALVMRRKQPLLSLGIGLFLVAHFLESTFIPLELVFEHRNYLAVLWVVIPVVYIATNVFHTVRYKKFFTLLSAVFVAGVSIQTHTRATEWSSDLVINSLAVESRPNSLRARSALAISYASRGDYEKSISQLREMRMVAPDDAYTLLAIVHTGCLGGLYQNEDFEIAKKQLEESEITLDVISVLEDIEHTYRSGVCKRPGVSELAQLYETAIHSSNIRMPSWAEARLLTLYANLQIDQSRIKEAVGSLQKASDLSPDSVGILLRLGYAQVVIGEFEPAQETLVELRNLNAGHLNSYSNPIDRLQAKLDSEMNKYSETDYE